MLRLRTILIFPIVFFSVFGFLFSFSIQEARAATLELQVGTSQDDLRRIIGNTNDFSLSAPDQYVGGWSAYWKYGGGMRFTGVTIPHGSTIGEAHLTLQCRGYYDGSPVNSRISAEKVDNAPIFANNASAFDTRWANRTTARVNWDDIPSWTVGNNYDSPDIKTVIQEIVNRSGWASGNAIVIFFDDFEDRTAHIDMRMRAFQSYDNSSASAPKLHIEYTPPLSVPTVTTNTATVNLSTNQATLNGTLVSRGGVSSCYVTFWYDKPGETGYLNYTGWQIISADNASFNAILSSPDFVPQTVDGKTYNYLAIADCTAWGGGTALTGVDNKKVVIYQTPGGQLSFTTPGTAPTAPTNLAGTPRCAGSNNPDIDLTWTDNSSNETGFKLYRGTTAGFTPTDPPLATLGASVTSYTDTTPAASTTYYYKIKAYNASGDSTYASSSGITTDSCAPTFVLTPSPATISVGGTQQFDGIYDSDGPGGSAAAVTITRTLITWSSNNTPVATINTSGLATGVSAGSATISGVYSGITATAALTVQSGAGGCSAGETEVTKEITTGSLGALIPFLGSSYDAIRFQTLFLKSEINQAGKINKISFQKYNSAAGTFNNLRIYLCHSSLSSLGTTFDSNCKDTLVQVSGPTSVTLSGSASTWLEFDVANNFNYNNIDNLIVEIRWNSDSGTDVSTLAQKVGVNRTLAQNSDSASSGSLTDFAYNLRTSICASSGCNLNRTGDYAITYSMFNGCCILNNLGTSTDTDYYLQNGNLTLQGGTPSGGCIQINADTTFQFNPGKTINLTKPNVYILKSATNTRILKQ